jgi:DNA repair protein SbcC/Rad50
MHDLETQLGEHQPLSDEDRAAAEARVKEAKIEADRIAAEKVAIDKALEWYEIKSRLDVQVSDGDAALMQALDTDQAAEADRATLMVVKQAFSLRAELEAAAATGRRLAEVEKALVSAVEAERKAAEECDQAVTASEAAKAERDQKRAAYDAIGPELDKAQRLDAMIETAKTDLVTRKSLLDRSLLAKDEVRKGVATSRIH